MQNSSFLLFLTGLGAGVGLSMLIAPRCGKDTRQLIVDKVNEGRTSVERGVERMSNSASELIDKGNALVNAVGAAKSAYTAKAVSSESSLGPASGSY